MEVSAKNAWGKKNCLTPAFLAHTGFFFQNLKLPMSPAVRAKKKKKKSINLDFEEKNFWGGSGHPSHPSYQKISAPKDTKAQPPLVRSNSLLAFGLSVLQRPGAQSTARDKKEKSSVPCACGASLQPTLPMT